MALKTKRFDASKYLGTPESRASLLEDALASGDKKYIAVALGHIAKAYGVAKLAEETGLTRQSIYNSFGERGNPTLETLLKILPHFEVALTATPKAGVKAKPAKKAAGKGKVAAAA